MRINVYSQELTDEVLLLQKESNTGLIYSAVQFILHSSPMLHHPHVKETVQCPRCGGKGWHMEGLGGAHEDCSKCDGKGTIDILEDDDRSAVTFWLPKSAERRRAFATAMREAATMIENAPAETGLD